MYNNIESINFTKEAFDNLPKIIRIEDMDQFYDVTSNDNSIEIEMGDCLLVNKNKNYYSYGAGPCACGVINTSDNKTFILHSVGDEFTEEEERVINNTKSGFFGGSTRTLAKFSRLFEKLNIQLIQPPNIDDDFNIALITKQDDLDILPGIYYCYAETPTADNLKIYENDFLN